MGSAGDIMDMWEGAEFDVSGGDARRNVPAMPKNNADYAAFTGGTTVAGLAVLTVLKGGPRHKKLMVELLCSAVCCILRDDANYSGSRTLPVALTGDKDLEAADLDRDAPATTNVVGLPEITLGEWLDVDERDPDELAAYVGTLIYAACKKPDEANIAAFGAKRASAATAGVIGAPYFYAPNSDFISLETMQKVHAAFTSHAVARAHLITKVVGMVPSMDGGAAAAFGSQFMLLRNHGMSALAIIIDGLLHCPWIREEFTECAKELEAANRAFKAVRRVPDENLRPYIKAIHGNRFVPVPYADISILVGICKSCLSRYRLSYANYRGGTTTPEIEARIQARMGQAAIAAPGGLDNRGDHAEE